MKTIKLTESDLIALVNRVLQEGHRIQPGDRGLVVDRRDADRARRRSSGCNRIVRVRIGDGPSDGAARAR